MKCFTKIFGLTVLGLVASAVNSWARLNETFDQCQTRYGFVVKVENGTRADYPQNVFEKDGIEIRIRFLNGKSAQETFSGTGAKIEGIAAEILNANAQHSTWSSTTVGQTTAYMRADGKATAEFRRNGHGLPAVLTIQTTDFTEAFNGPGTGF